MNNPFTNARGMSFVSVLASMLILAVLYFGYFKFQSMTGEGSVGETAIDAGRRVACRTQRQAVERDITAWTFTHSGETPTLSLLERGGVNIPDCPEGGTYSLDGKRLRCSMHD